MWKMVLVTVCLALAGPAAGAQDQEAERDFARLLFGLYFEDPCANTSDGARHCAPVFSDRRMEFADEKAQQVYRFGANPCVVEAETTVSATGRVYRATFNLQNALYVNLNSARQEGSLMEVEIFLQGRDVLSADGKSGNVLIFIHKYRATASGDVGHDVKGEVLDMRKALKAYQARYCSDMG